MVGRDSASPISQARSVIVCAYTMNRWDELLAAVGSVTSQLADDDELIVVVDNNAELLDRAKTELATATVVANDATPGLSGARNTGVATALNPIAVFLDDDAVAAPGWLDALTAPLADATIAGSGGTVVPAWSGGSAPAWFPAEFNWVVGCTYDGHADAGPIRNPIGCSMAFTTEAIEAVGGFTGRLGRVGRTPVGGEETELSIRIAQKTGHRIWHTPDAVVEHQVTGERLTMGYFVRRCYAEGTSKAAIARLVGADSATSSERRHVKTLLTGITQRIVGSVRGRNPALLAQAAAIAAGTVVAAVGFAIGAIREIAGR